MPEYKNSDMLYTIEEYVHNRKYREVLRYRYCDSLTYEEIACFVNFSPQHVKHICLTYKALLMGHL